MGVASPALAVFLSGVCAGMEEDRVGQFDQAEAKGQEDARFSVYLDTGGIPPTVKELALQSSDAQGRPSAWLQRWDTRPGNYWLLGVYREGKRLNPVDRDIAHPLHGTARYDLYANRPGGFRQGAHYRVAMRFAEGDEADLIVRIGPPRLAVTGQVSFSWGGLPAR